MQDALAAATSGDEIWVAAGEYYPGAASDRLATFALKNGVALYGGFAGNETKREERNWEQNLTILSGDDPNDEDIWGNVSSIVTAIDVDGSTILDGFTITRGGWNGGSNFGGGMQNRNASPTVSNTTFSGNIASMGGGMYNNNSSPTLTNVIFSSNILSGCFTYYCGGGGMYNENNSSPILINVTFISNNNWEQDQAVQSDIPDDEVGYLNLMMTPTPNGGGMKNATNSNPTLINVSFLNNVASYGGAMHNSGSSPILQNVIFSGNEARSGGFPLLGVGGAVYNIHANPQLTNVTFSGNQAYRGGGMFNSSSNPTFTNVTFSGNTTACWYHQ